MMGDGPLRESSMRLADALGIADGVTFAGPGSHLEVVEAMRGVRAFVQHSRVTSYGDSEGTPVAVLEAGAAGLPVVASRHGGIKDVVVDGETGFLVDEGDFRAMAEHMTALAKDPALAAAVGLRAREYVGSHFSMEKLVGDLWEIIQTTIRK